MGVYFKLVNPTKRQYLDPSTFDDCPRFGSVFAGKYFSYAFKLLISDWHAEQRKTKHAIQWWNLEGSWVGDPVIFTGDDWSPPNPAGFKTSTNEKPCRNLYLMAAEEFWNISTVCLAMLCESHRMANEIVDISRKQNFLFLNLCDLLMQSRDLSHLRFEIESTYSPKWQLRYAELAQELRPHTPVPIVPMVTMG